VDEGCKPLAEAFDDKWPPLNQLCRSASIPDELGPEYGGTGMLVDMNNPLGLGYKSDTLWCSATGMSHLE
jgi:hypothetical protein